MRHFTGEPMSGRCAKVKSGLWALLALLALAGCDAQRISELEEGVATEARQRPSGTSLVAVVSWNTTASRLASEIT